MLAIENQIGTFQIAERAGVNDFLSKRESRNVSVADGGSR